jgi:hypothetical protein
MKKHRKEEACRFCDIGLHINDSQKRRSCPNFNLNFELQHLLEELKLSKNFNLVVSCSNH